MLASKSEEINHKDHKDHKEGNKFFVEVVDGVGSECR
jgi:hypothetical protein